MTQPKKIRWLTAAVLATAVSGVTLAKVESGVAERPPSTPSPTEAAKLMADKQPVDTAPADKPAPHVTDAPSSQCPADMPANVSLDWRFKPDSLSEVRAEADSIVLAQVVRVVQGADNVLPNPNEPGGEVRTPTQVVTLAVKKAYKGPSRRGETVTVGKLGGPCYKVEEDPAYAPGETHLLMLERGPRGHLQTVAPEGRYKQAADGTLAPVTADAVTAAARGKRPDAVAR
jgi:hypothetical protein